MTLDGVSVEVEGDWGGDPVRAQNVSFSVKIEAKASKVEILDLVRHTDKVAEIHNSLCMGTNVMLEKVEAIPT